VKTFASIVVVCVAMAMALGGCGDDAASSTVSAMKPKPPVPQGAHSEKLVVTDLEEGTGAVADTGDRIAVHYVAGIYETGEEIESGWVEGEPHVFTLGSGAMLDGWEEGLPGMRVGGRRQFLIPTSRAVSPPGSEVGDTLVYVVDLLEIREDVN
jgi:peptidylprolyl isomerase